MPSITTRLCLPSFVQIHFAVCVVYGASGNRGDSASAWQTTNIETWPLRALPLNLYNAPITTASTTLTTALPANVKLQPTEKSLKLWQAPETAAQTYQNGLYLWNLPVHAAPPLLLSYIHAAAPTATPMATTTTTTIPTITTTPIPSTPPTPVPIKLRAAPATKLQSAYLTNDVRLLQAVSRINPEFVIESIVPVPGRHILSSINTQPLNSAIRTATAAIAPVSQPLQPTARNSASLLSKNSPLVKKQNAAVKKSKKSKRPVATEPGVVVEATGRTAIKGNIPQVPFGTYFLPYFAHGPVAAVNSKTAALILEPHSKAVVGNGGTAISTPLSRAFLKRGVPTNVYFNPESVAIAGVGGKAHAQADLELNLINRR